MNWNDLTSEEQLDKIVEDSNVSPQLIFKHSTRCSISGMALSRFERQWNQDKVGNLTPHFLDLIAYRNISNLIAEKLQVTHESPQVLVIENGKCSFHSSHNAIYFEDIAEQVAS